ncbi:hypothetical protein GP486_002842 [Trichoglossum hirsutum]|uniref:NACHT domain-containing protein n=1 Tax=Trichoglossum hirsutum TaxID=265104 RepID=A0A9P8LE69_9PEZI|nr:hypothetical protein GP486_002842 [Trichoglossum hirsutum]
MSLNSNSVAKSLLDALSDFQSSLTPEQRARLQALNAIPDTAAIITFTKEIDDDNAKRRSRCVASRLCGILQSVQEFSSIVGAIATFQPGIGALFWGTIKFALLFASRFSMYFDKLSTIFMNIHNDCPRYMEYRVLYADSKRLQVVLCDYYATVVKLCQKVVEVGERQGECSKGHSVSKNPINANQLALSGLRQLTMALWRPFEAEFGSFQEKLQEQNEEVKKEISLASKQATERERQLQIAERKKSSWYRKKEDLHRLEETQWRLQADRRKSRLRRQELLEKLSDYNYMSSFKQARKKRHWTTSTWLLDTDDYRDWLAGELSLFWCSGLLGTGKTILTAGVIDDLFRHVGSTAIRVIFFFCQFDNMASLTARGILGSLTKQCLNAEIMPDTVEARLTSLFSNGSPDLDDLEALFVDQVVASKGCFIVIDGVDECAKAERNAIFTALHKITDRPQSSHKIFIASRPQVGLEIERLFKSHHQISTDSPHVYTDITKYIKFTLEEKKGSGDLKVGHTGLMGEIEDVLAREAQGMYLLVVCQICEICDQVNDEGIREALGSLPKSLPEWYDRILTKIVKSGKGEIARKVFRWVAAAKRPLSLDELREAIAVEPCQAFRRLQRLANDISQVVSWCGDLVCIDEEEQVVRFSHPTVKQYFISEPHNSQLARFYFQLSEVDHDAGEVCVTYLNFNDFKRQLTKVSNTPPLSGQAVVQASLSASLGTGLASSLSKLRQARKSQSRAKGNVLRQLQDIAGVTDAKLLKKLQNSYPFLVYVSKHWLLHTTNFTKDGSKTWNLWKMLFFPESSAPRPWSSCEWSCMSPNVLRWVVEYDHTGLLQLVIDSDTNPLSPEKRRYLLVESAAIGHLNVADFLINNSLCLRADLNTAIVASARNGHLNVVERLIAANAAVNLTCSGGCTALEAASAGGHLEVVERLLAAKADVNSTYGDCTALEAASAGGHLEVVERLLAANADTNMFHPRGHTALQAASAGGHLEVVERLLAAHANVNSTYGDCTALQAASAGGHLEVVERLLAAKADVNSTYGGCTALQAASTGGHLEVVERLLAAHADVNSTYGDCTALEAASAGGHNEVVGRLIAANAKANLTCLSGRTALEAASAGGHLEVVERLLAANANVNFYYPGSRTALQAASAGGHLRVIERLKSAGARI